MGPPEGLALSLDGPVSISARWEAVEKNLQFEGYDVLVSKKLGDAVSHSSDAESILIRYNFTKTGKNAHLNDIHSWKVKILIHCNVHVCIFLQPKTQKSYYHYF